MKVSRSDGARVWSKSTSPEESLAYRESIVSSLEVSFRFRPMDTLRPAGFVNHFIRRNKVSPLGALVFNMQGRFLLRQDPLGSGISHSTL